jgi:hypothetical protein
MRNQKAFLDRWSRSYVIVPWPFREKPWPPNVQFEELSSDEAVRVVRDCAGNPERPDHGLLRLLGIDEHPLNMEPGELERGLERLLGGRSARFVVYRRMRSASSASERKAHDAPPSAPAPSVTAEPKSWIGVKLVSTDGKPLTGLRLEFTSADGAVRTLSTDSKGEVRVDDIPAGNCKIALPRGAR